MNLGKSIRVALAIKDMKNKDLAEKLETSSQQVSNWIKTGAMNNDTLQTICRAIDMPVSEFIALGE